MHTESILAPHDDDPVFVPGMMMDPSQQHAHQQHHHQHHQLPPPTASQHNQHRPHEHAGQPPLSIPHPPHVPHAAQPSAQHHQAEAVAILQQQHQMVSGGAASQQQQQQQPHHHPNNVEPPHGTLVIPAPPQVAAQPNAHHLPPHHQLLQHLQGQPPPSLHAPSQQQQQQQSQQQAQPQTQHSHHEQQGLPSSASPVGGVNDQNHSLPQMHVASSDSRQDIQGHVGSNHHQQHQQHHHQQQQQNCEQMEQQHRQQQDQDREVEQQEQLMSQHLTQPQQQLMQMYMAAVQQNPAMMFMPYMAQYPMYSRMALPTDQVTEDPPTYVNAKQYRRIIKRREARAKLEARRKVPQQRKSFLHKSRHDHACRRVRGPGGRFLTKAELSEYRKQLEAQDAENAKAGGNVGGNTQVQSPVPLNMAASAIAPTASSAGALRAPVASTNMPPASLAGAAASASVPGSHVRSTTSTSNHPATVGGRDGGGGEMRGGHGVVTSLAYAKSPPSHPSYVHASMVGGGPGMGLNAGASVDGTHPPGSESGSVYPVTDDASAVVAGRASAATANGER